MTSRFSSALQNIFLMTLMLSFMGLRANGASVNRGPKGHRAPAEAAISESSAGEIYTVPLRFEVLGAGVEAPPLELEYDLSDSTVLKMSGVEIQVKTVFPSLIEGRQFDSKLTLAFTPEESKQRYFVFQWPEVLIPEGQFEMISQSGRVVWKFEIGKGSKKKWQEFRANVYERMVKLGRRPEEFAESRFFKVPFAIPFVESGHPLIEQREPFRFCLTKTEDLGYSRLCSALYAVSKIQNQIKMNLHPISAAPARVIAFNEGAPLQRVLPLKKIDPVQFYAETESGVSYEFVGQPLRMNFVEMVLSPEFETANLVGWGPIPRQQVSDLTADRESYLAKLLGWQQTIGDFRQFWQAKVNLKQPFIYLPGAGGGVFKQKFVIDKLPSEGIRPRLNLHSARVTYVDGVKIFGTKKKEQVLNTQQNSIDIDENKTDFVWFFGATKRGELNKSYLNIKDSDQQFRMYYEVYKGFPRELSARMSGIISSEGKVVIMGELSLQYWFEDVFGWTNYYLARQRWGVSAKFFQSLTDFSLGSVKAPFKVTTSDLKYRLTPGLWNRDETWGAILGYQKIQYYSFDFSLMGAGFFWARSMPKVFDDIFNFVNMFRYPKWVNMEFVYYLQSAESRYKAKFPNYALNFQGKIQWTPAFFGEVGFGVKQYNVDDQQTRLNMKFGSLYGNAGIGFNF